MFLLLQTQIIPEGNWVSGSQPLCPADTAHYSTPYTRCQKLSGWKKHLLLKDYCFKYCGALQTVMTETHWAELRPNIFVHCLLPELTINVKDARQMRSAETNVYAASFTRIPWLSKYIVALHPYRSTHTVEMTIWIVCVKIECILLHCTQPNPGREKNGKRL